MTSAAPEPTDEQYGQAGAIVYTVLSGVGGYGSLLDPEKTTRNVARALAAAVAAEREKYLRVAEACELNSQGNFTPGGFAWVVAKTWGKAASRIREVSS